jgi:hypothetical protein
MTSLKRGIKVRSVVGTMMWLGLSIGILLMIGWHCQDEPAAQSITHSGLFRYYGR